MSAFQFTFDGDEVTFSANGRGDDWNNYVRPVVDRPTLEAVIVRFNGLDSERTIDLTFHSWGATAFEYEWDDEGRKLIGEHQLNRDSASNYVLDLGLALVEA